MQHSMFVLMDKFTRPILPPLIIQKDCGKYTIENGITGRVYLINGSLQDLLIFISAHNEIWIGFKDTSTEEDVHLENWVRPQ